MNIAGVAQFGDGWKSFGAELNSALGKVAHIGIGASSASFDGISDKMLDAHGTLGIALNAGNISLCPYGIGVYAKGPGDGISTTGYGGGIGIAISLTPGSSFELIPFGGITYLSSTTKADGCGASDCSLTDSAWDMKGGLGIRFGGGMQLSPQFSKSNAEGSKIAYGVSLSFPFGKQ